MTWCQGRLFNRMFGQRQWFRRWCGGYWGLYDFGYERLWWMPGCRSYVCLECEDYDFSAKAVKG